MDLDDEQVYDQDDLKENYIMYKTLRKRGIEEDRKREEKKNYCNINFQK